MLLFYHSWVFYNHFIATLYHFLGLTLSGETTPTGSQGIPFATDGGRGVVERAGLRDQRGGRGGLSRFGQRVTRNLVLVYLVFLN